jgi:hypothetical protein
MAVHSQALKPEAWLRATFGEAGSHYLTVASVLAWLQQ